MMVMMMMMMMMMRVKVMVMVMIVMMMVMVIAMMMMMTTTMMMVMVMVMVVVVVMMLVVVVVVMIISQDKPKPLTTPSPSPSLPSPTRAHRSQEERLAAAQILSDTQLPCPLLVDTMQDKASHSYGVFSERLCIVLDGRIVYLGIHGPVGYSVEEVEQWLKSYKNSSSKAECGT